MKYEVETPQRGHEQGAEEGLGEHRRVAAQQAQEAAPGPGRGAAGPGAGRVRVRYEQQQIPGPALAKIVPGELLDPDGRIGHDDRVPLHLVKDHKMSQAVGRLQMGDGGEGYVGQGFVGPFDAFAGQAELLGGAQQSQQTGAGPVRARQVAQLLQGDGNTVVERDRRQRRRAAVTPIGLSDERVTSQHAEPPPRIRKGGGARSRGAHALLIAQREEVPMATDGGMGE